MAMFEETRKTAVERSQPVFGKFFMFLVLFVTAFIYVAVLQLCLQVVVYR